MPAPAALVRIASLKTAAEFRARVAGLGLEIPCDDEIIAGPGSPLAQPLSAPTINGKTIGNRWTVQPMEGWDGNIDGSPGELTARRWRRFGESGAKLIFGGEAMAVRPDGRDNPNQLVIGEAQRPALAELREELVRAHRGRHGNTNDLVIGFQLTHSGRFCRPTLAGGKQPLVAFRHPLLDARTGVTGDAQVVTDDEVERLIAAFIRAARVAREAGADFVDIKHCHGYLLHEFLAAHTRPGRYGGSFENRTRILREIVAGIRADGNPIDLAVRLSAFDFVPFKPDPARAEPGKLGPGTPEDFSQLLPYRYAFGVNADNPVEPDLTEPVKFARLCADLGVKLLNLSAGSPYYNPHILRPAAYPPSDGYQPPEDPLIGVARHLRVTREIRAAAPPSLAIVGSGYSYLQEYLPHVAQAVVRGGWVDLVGIGRMALSYPTLPAEALSGGKLNPRLLCRTFSDCTTAPRNGLVSGCYPLDSHFAQLPEAAKLKELKRAR